MKAEFKKFISQLETSDNKVVLEAVKHGFNVIFEGYADVRDTESIDALSMFNRQAANVAMSQGNPVLQFLQNSAEQTSQMYTFDEETELDGRDTIDYRDYIIPTEDELVKEDNFGLTAYDLADKSSDTQIKPASANIDDFTLDF